MPSTPHLGSNINVIYRLLVSQGLKPLLTVHIKSQWHPLTVCILDVVTCPLADFIWSEMFKRMHRRCSANVYWSVLKILKRKVPLFPWQKKETINHDNTWCFSLWIRTDQTGKLGLMCCLLLVGGWGGVRQLGHHLSHSHMHSYDTVPTALSIYPADVVDQIVRRVCQLEGIHILRVDTVECHVTKQKSTLKVLATPDVLSFYRSEIRKHFQSCVAVFYISLGYILRVSQKKGAGGRVES